MGHYDCRHCGVWMCGGDCRTEKTPEQLECEAAKERKEIARSHRWVLQEEEKRLQRLAEARAFFQTHDEDGNPLETPNAA